jgi:hypothetical protein
MSWSAWPRQVMAFPGVMAVIAIRFRKVEQE